jgi:hypothetical protein
MESGLLGGLSERERLFVVIDEFLPYHLALSDLPPVYLRVFRFYKGGYLSRLQFGVIALEKPLARLRAGEDRDEQRKQNQLFLFHNTSPKKICPG